MGQLASLALFWVCVSCPATAAPPLPPTIGPTGAMPWSDGSRFDECGQGCLYEKANENISLQIGYIKERIALLDEELTNHQDSNVTAALGELCLSGESAQTCLDRYKRMEVLHLEKLRKALISNEDARARLMSRRVGLDGRVEGKDAAAFEQSVPPGAPPKLAQTPYVPSYEDLRQQYDAESVQLRALTSPQYQEWLRNYPTRPSRDDFVKVRQVLRNPNNPEDGTVTELDTDPSGNLQYDEASYQVALADYTQAVLNSRTKEQAWMADRDRLTQASVSPRGAIAMNALVHDEDKRAFNRARAEMVQQANIVIQRNNPGRIVSVAEMQFGNASASGRAPSAATPAPAAATPPPSSSPGNVSQVATIRSSVQTSQDPADPNAQVVGVRHNVGDHSVQTTTVSRDPRLVQSEIGRIEGISFPEP